MFLNKQTVICIKSNPPSETWDYFNEKTELINLPKRNVVLELPETILSSLYEPLVEPSSRILENRQHIRTWATHMATLEQFVESAQTDYLFVCTDNIDINSLEQIKEQPGLTLYDPDALVYLVDLPTAKAILENNKIYYNRLIQIFIDLAALKLIQLNFGIEFPRIKLPLYAPFFYILLFFLVCVFFFIYITRL